MIDGDNAAILNARPMEKDKALADRTVRTFCTVTLIVKL